MAKPFSIRERIKSFKYAFQGISFLVKEEHNFRIHLLASVVVITAGTLLQVSNKDWCWLVLSIGLVLMAEAFNSAIEKLVDLKQPGHNSEAGMIKDIAAAAVLITSGTALIIGALVFWPYLQALF